MIFRVLVALCFTSSVAWANFLPKSFKADFTQIYTSTLTNKEKKTQGEMKYLYPGHFYFEVKGDESVTFMTNNKKSWVYNPPFIEGEKGVVRESSSGSHSFTRFFDVLSKGLKTNDVYAVESNGKLALITFSKTIAKELGISSAKLFFLNQKKTSELTLKDLEKIEFTYTVKKPNVSLVFSSYEENEKINKDDFTFKTPENTEVINE